MSGAKLKKNIIINLAIVALVFFGYQWGVRGNSPAEVASNYILTGAKAQLSADAHRKVAALQGIPTQLAAELEAEIRTTVEELRSVADSEHNDILTRLSDSLEAAQRATGGQALIRALSRMNSATQETNFQIFQDIAGPSQFVTVEEASSYMRDFLDIVSQTGGRNIRDSDGYTWGDYVRRELTSPTRIQALWRNVLAQHVLNSGTEVDPVWVLSAPINRTTLNNDLWGWLLVADDRIRRTRWHNNARLPGS